MVSGQRGRTDEGLEAAILPGKGGSIMLLEVQPGSSRPGKLSYDPWRKRIKLTVAEEAQKGRANAEVVATVSGVLGVPQSSICITSGATDRRKAVAVLGLEPSEVLERLVVHVKGD